MMSSSASLEDQIQGNRSVGVAICERLGEEINKLGFQASDIKHYPHYDEATFLLIKDPYTGLKNLTAYWYSLAQPHRIGLMQFNSDGSVYAEYDVVKPHPTKTHWFVEGVTVWGKLAQLKAEAKLLPMPE
ncbi:MAG: hypothetical protein ABL903_01025 [Methylococcales bacterium]